LHGTGSLTGFFVAATLAKGWAASSGFNQPEHDLRHGAFQSFVNSGDIKGESTDKDHKDWDHPQRVILRSDHHPSSSASHSAAGYLQYFSTS
jgi:hypothetical protein